MEAIAHHNKKAGASQTLRTHLEEVSALCAGYAQKLGLPRSGELIGLLHLSKYSESEENNRAGLKQSGKSWKADRPGHPSMHGKTQILP